ncbi:hypothetical protein LJR153_003135 [Paenibacillus sp. LjRoot153]|uniref:hypothetical protein n=1 Tax=Paenibacillus sp. LjRoot153 TaxID=3342270 RepID=UPI003ECEA719
MEASGCATDFFGLTLGFKLGVNVGLGASVWLGARVGADGNTEAEGVLAGGNKLNRLEPEASVTNGDTAKSLLASMDV